MSKILGDLPVLLINGTGIWVVNSKQYSTLGDIFIFIGVIVSCIIAGYVSQGIQEKIKNKKQKWAISQ